MSPVISSTNAHHSRSKFAPVCGLDVPPFADEPDAPEPFDDPLPFADEPDVDDPDVFDEGGAVGEPVTPVEALEVPEPFVAVAVNVYCVPLVRPVIVHDVAGAVTVQYAPPGCAVTL